MPVVYVFPVSLGALGVLTSAYSLARRHVIVVDHRKGVVVLSRRGLFRGNDDSLLALDEIAQIRLDEYKNRRWAGHSVVNESLRATVSIEMEYGDAHGLGSGDPWPAAHLAKILQKLLRVPLVKVGPEESPTQESWF